MRGLSGVHWGLVVSVGAQGPAGVLVDWGFLGCEGSVRGALGAGRECRCSGARSGIGGIRAIGGF